MKYKYIENGKTVYIGDSNTIPENAVEITEEEYKTLQDEYAERGKELSTYINKALSGEITLENVPEEYRNEVSDALNRKEPNNPYGIDNETYNQVIDDYTMELIESGVIA